MRNPQGSQVFHGVPQGPSIDVLIALELDLAHLNLGTFLYDKRQSDRGWRNLPNFGTDRGKLPAMLRQQTFDRHFRFLHFRWIILTLHRESDLGQLEAIENVTGGDGTQADIVNFTNCRFFFDLNDEPPAFGSLFAAKLYILEITCVPQRVEITFQRSCVVNVARVCEDACADRFGRNAAVFPNIDFGDSLALR